jgi:acyl carrier protein
MSTATQTIELSPTETLFLDAAKRICTDNIYLENADELTLDTSFKEVGMDSIDKICLLQDFEEQLDSPICFDNVIIGELDTMRDTIKYLTEKFGADVIDTLAVQKLQLKK